MAEAPQDKGQLHFSRASTCLSPAGPGKRWLPREDADAFPMHSWKSHEGVTRTPTTLLTPHAGLTRTGIAVAMAQPACQAPDVAQPSDSDDDA